MGSQFRFGRGAGHLASALAIVASTALTVHAGMTISSLTGPVTQSEINSFISYMATQTAPTTPWGGTSSTAHNAWADGSGGSDLEAMGLMYEVSGSSTILNQLVSWTDICCSERNDLMSAANGGHRLMWTGRIEPVWVPNAPNSTAPTYAGGENGDTKYHILCAAMEILNHRNLWNLTVPDRDPFRYGVTYLDRAKTYLKMCDYGNDQYDVRQFVDPSTHLIVAPPNWPSNFHTMVANNIMLMMDKDFARCAECHAILNDSPYRVAEYRAITKASCEQCINGMMHAYMRKSQIVYKYYYYPFSTGYIEDNSHASFDMLGIYAIAAAPGNPFDINLSTVVPFANTVVDVMSLGNNEFAGNVDGSGTPQNYMPDAFIRLADWNPSCYTICATADFDSGYYSSHAEVDATILWMKNRRYLGLSPTH